MMLELLDTTGLQLENENGETSENFRIERHLVAQRSFCLLALEKSLFLLIEWRTLTLAKGDQGDSLASAGSVPRDLRLHPQTHFQSSENENIKRKAKRTPSDTSKLLNVKM